jgi:hypothetical protein
MVFFIYDSNGKLSSTNVISGEIKCCHTCSHGASSTQKQYCQIKSANVRSGSIVDKSGYTIQLCCTHAPDSKKVWKDQLVSITQLVPVIISAKQKASHDASQDIDRLLHNLKKFNAHCIQISDFFLESTQSRNNNSSQQDSIRSIIASNPSRSAEQLLKLVKNSRLIQAEISVFDKLYKNEDIALKISKHLVHRIVNSIYRLFYSSFEDIHVSVTLADSFYEILVDYETFTVALTHMIENMTKYVMPHSEARIYFENHEEQIHIIFAMTSLQILDEELSDIFQEGHSGFYSSQLGLKGSGVGMFIIKRFLKINNGDFEVKINLNHNETKYYSNAPYQDNLFILKVPKAPENYQAARRRL